MTSRAGGDDYDADEKRLIERHVQGLVLDCSRGPHPLRYAHVVDLDCTSDETPGVVGALEALPFRDESFDAVIASGVLERSRDPCRCAREIVRVMKPGAELLCRAAFLEPDCGDPDYFYPMTHQGLRNLFEPALEIERVDVAADALPIRALASIVGCWAQGLDGAARAEFAALRMRDLLQPAPSYADRSFVEALAPETQMRLAAGCHVFAHRRVIEDEATVGDA